jgi:CBS domain-containing protein
MNDLPDDLTRFLADVAPFDDHPDAVEPAARALVIRYLREGETAAPEHGDCFPEDPWSLYIVRSGAVELCDADGQVLERRSEGELFGHPIRFGQKSIAYTVRAGEDCLLWHLPAGAVRNLADRVPEFNAFLSAAPGARLRRVDALRSRQERLADLGLRTPVSIGPGASIADAAERMADHQVSCLPVVVDERIVGILTDRDLRNRVVARRVDPDLPVEQVMTADPACVDEDLRIEAALVEMVRRGIHHMPVLAEGRLAGVISAGDLMRTQSPHPLRLVRDLARAATVDDVASIARSGPALLAGLVEAGTDVSQLGRMAGLITDATTRRLIELAEAELGDTAGELRLAGLRFPGQAGTGPDQRPGQRPADRRCAQRRRRAVVRRARRAGLQRAGRGRLRVLPRRSDGQGTMADAPPTVADDLCPLDERTRPEVGHALQHFLRPARGPRRHAHWPSRCAARCWTRRSPARSSAASWPRAP